MNLFSQANTKDPTREQLALLRVIPRRALRDIPPRDYDDARALEALGLVSCVLRDSFGHPVRFAVTAAGVALLRSQRSQSRTPKRLAPMPRQRRGATPSLEASHAPD